MTSRYVVPPFRSYSQPCWTADDRWCTDGREVWCMGCGAEEGCFFGTSTRTPDSKTEHGRCPIAELAAQILGDP